MSELLSATTNNFAFEKWECLDSDTGEDLAEEVRKYHIPDFSNWNNPAVFTRFFAQQASFGKSFVTGSSTI
jgi:hypothetical protein